MILRRILPLFLLVALAGCAAVPARPVHAPPADWAFEQSDLAPEPEYRFGKLDNGMRYIIRRNGTPAGTALVRMDIAAGSLDEREGEQGFAHFVEHMAFNGSTRVPEGEMVRLLERSGLSFGADTNAQTGFEQTLYTLDLPRNDEGLLDTSLMLLRETASELSFDPEAVSRERGVVLSELRDGQGYQLANVKDQFAFLYPQAIYRDRFPIGTVATLRAATAETLRGFWAREYVPAKTTVIVVGDFDPDKAEALVRARFGDWKPAPPFPRPAEGTVDPGQRRAVDIHLDPALSERITVSRHGPYLDEPDTAASRRVNLLRRIGYGIVNRRLQRVSRRADPPFRGAGLGTGDVFKVARTTNLVVDTVDGGWRRGLAAAAAEYARALTRGFTPAEVAEQIAIIRAGLETSAAAAGTRSHGTLVQAALALVRDGDVPTSPASALQRFTAFAPKITPKDVLVALKSEAVPLRDPLIRFQGRTAPRGGTRAISAAWHRAARAHSGVAAPAPVGPFAYTDFGPPGMVTYDVVEPRLGIRTLRFANGVRLNLKRTELEKDRIAVRVTLDGGEMLDTRDNPLATEMLPMLPAGGLGKHSQDDLQTLLAGRFVGGDIAAAGDVFTAAATTTPHDLELQLQFLAAWVTDPGYRAEGEVLYQQNLSNFFARYRSTPGSALGNALPGILSDEDPRFALLAPAEYHKLGFAKLRDDLADRLAHGAIEIGLVGDLDEAQAIAMVARTFGALPAREPDFRPYEAERQRPFTRDRSLRIVRHTGEKDQAIVRLVWPTRDDSDPVETLTLELLQQVVAVEVLDTVREKLGKSYSPGAQSSLSGVWRDYGTFSIQASVDVADVAATRAALEETVRDLRTRPVDADVIQRARAPMLERLDNALKGNGGWLSLVERAQSKPGRIDRYLRARERLSALTAGDLMSAARRYLRGEEALTVVALPEGAEAPAK